MGQDLEENQHHLERHLFHVTSPDAGGYSTLARARKLFLPVQRFMGNQGVSIS